MYDIDRTSLTPRLIIRLSIFRIHCSTNRLIRLQRIVVRLCFKSGAVNELLITENRGRATCVFDHLFESSST